MVEFIKQRLANRLAELDKKEETDEQALQKLRETRSTLIKKHRLATYITDAAHRVTNLQVGTHAAKFSHPDARGGLYSDGCAVSDEDTLVGTHSLGQQKSLDVVGAGSLDVWRFLNLEVDGVTLYQRAQNRDSALLDALPGSLEEKQSLVEAFASLTSTASNKPVSDQLTKQIYWHIENESYHLLSPLFPTSLVQCVYKILEESRFSPESKAARDAKNKGVFHPHGYRDWLDLLIWRFGGRKAQNISQLNSERGGKTYLLPSHPPRWDLQGGVSPPLNVDTLFNRLPSKINTKAESLRRYLIAVSDWNNHKIREGRRGRVSEIIDDFIDYSMQIQSLDAGWSADERCKLSNAQCYWLDPRRDDEAFQNKRNSTDWQKEIARGFGMWLNHLLGKERLAMGDPEYNAWRGEFEKELSAHIRGISRV